jgi:hypothetical protein
MAQDDQARVIQLTRNGPVLSGAAAALRDRFAARHCIALKSLLAPQLLEEFQAQVDGTGWQRGDEYTAGTGNVLTSSNRAASSAIHFLLNNPDCLSLIRTLTGCDAITEFRSGAVYRMAPNSGHEIGWHDDLDHGDSSARENRRVGLSLNLSTAAFKGGTFELRERRTRKLIARVNNTGFGDALLFRVSRELEHRVTPIEDGPPKTAFTGWFCATGESYLERVLEQMSHQHCGSR